MIRSLLGLARAHLLATVSLLCAAGSLQAHEMDLSLRTGENMVSGMLTYSDGSVAVGSYVQIVDLTGSAYSEIAVQTDEDGSFTVPAIPGHRYAITAAGDEGHQVTAEIEAPASGGLPLYVIVGALLVLSIGPALWLQRRDRAAGNGG